MALLPILVSKAMGIPNQGFGGTSVLIVVGVLLDTIAQIEQHRTLRKYDGFMKTGPGQVPGAPAALHVVGAVRRVSR